VDCFQAHVETVGDQSSPVLLEEGNVEWTCFRQWHEWPGGGIQTNVFAVVIHQRVKNAVPFSVLLGSREEI